MNREMFKKVYLTSIVVLLVAAFIAAVSSGIVRIIFAVIALAFLAKIVLTLWATKLTAAVSWDVLEALNKSGRPMNITEISKACHRNSGIVTNSVNFLHKRNLVAGTHDRNRITSAMDYSRYSITHTGRQDLAGRRK